MGPGGGAGGVVLVPLLVGACVLGLGEGGGAGGVVLVPLVGGCVGGGLGFVAAGVGGLVPAKQQT